jgi:PAS domain S-box-containing protein
MEWNMGRQVRKKTAVSRTTAGTRTQSRPQKTGTGGGVSGVRRRLFDSLIEALPDTGIIIDKNGVLLSWNKSAREKLTQKAVPGKATLFDVFSHVNPQFWKKKVCQCLAEKKTLRFERQYNGQYLFHNIHPVVDARGEISFIVVFVQDITEYRYAENALKESEQKYRELVENISDTIYALNEDGAVIYINPAVEAFLGFTPEEVTGRPLADYLHPSDIILIKSDLAGFLSGRLQQKEYRFIHKNGALRWGRVSSHPLVFKNEVIGYQGVITDITQAKSFNLNLLKSVQENILTNMTSSFSAEIGVPLKRAREKLLSRNPQDRNDGGIDESIRELMHDLEGISLYLKNMNSFMEKINEGSAVVDINSLVENGLILLKRQFEKSGVAVTTRLSRQLEPVAIDPFALVQVFINIFNYSIEAQSGRGEDRTLHVTTDMETDRVVVDIQDASGRISDELIDHLADPFYTHHRRKGAGIGLAIARQLVESESGEFCILTGKGQRGLHILIRLPAFIQTL